LSFDGYEHLHVTPDPDGRVVTLRFEHGKANEMGSAQLRELERLADELASSDAVALITHSTKRSSKGTPIFVAGANVTERVGWTDDQVKAHVRWQRAVLATLRRAPVFHVVVVEGVALGWGTEYLLVGDYRVATPAASFALPETGLGILPGAGGTGELWAQIGAPHALRLGMTGERIDADEAARIGLVQEVAPDAEAALARARALAELCARRSPTALAAFKSAVIEAVGQPSGERTEGEAVAYERCVDTGQAAIGREHFSAIRKGEVPPWGPRR
jgi:enoyl-CoA hydratase/carnithine racemase